MFTAGRGQMMLKWLRNLLLAAATLSIGLALQAMLDLRQQVETALPTPVAFGDDRLALPVFGEEAAGDIAYSNCLACHWDMLAKSVGLPADPENLGLRAQIAQLTQDAGGAQTEEPASDVIQAPLPTLPPLPQIRPRGTPGAESQPTATPTPSPGTPVRLTIPSIKLDSPVVAVAAATQNGRSVWEVPRDVVGWYRATALAGAAGNTVMSGHVAQREGLGVFRDLHLAKLGDAIEVETDTTRLRYTVHEIGIVLPSETGYLQPTPEATLTLITCTGHYDVATRSFSHRLIVTAKAQ